MPHLRFGQFLSTPLQRISALMADLCALTGGKPEFVTLECVPSQWVRDGQPEAGFPFVELVWFERPQEMQDAAAALITRHLKGVLGSRPMWWCRCLPIVKSHYYSNGQHY